jgi:hypothetical protein
MRRAGPVALLVTAAIGLLALALEAAGDKRELAFTLGVVPNQVAAAIPPGAQACQAPIAVPEEFQRVQLVAGRPDVPGPNLRLSVLTPGGRELGAADVEGGYFDRSPVTADVGPVSAGRRVSVCAENVGLRRVNLYGNVPVAAATSQTLVQGEPLPTDLSVVFLHDSRRSVLSQLPDVFDRASVFRPGWVGPWLFWLLSAVVLLGVPLLLARALAESEDAPAERP